MNGITQHDITNVKYITVNDGTFFDLIDKDGYCLITDYHALSRKIILSEGNVPPRLGEEKKRLRIDSIDGLKNVLDGYISAAQQIFERFYSIDFSDIDKNLLTEQLIFDLLFDKYRQESVEMTQHGYSSSDYLMNILEPDAVRNIFADKVRNCIKRGMNIYSEMIKNSPELQEELETLGINHNIYEKYFSPKANENAKKKKARYVWNYMYCNQYMITSRQYRRQLKEDGNYTCERFVDDLKDYHSFVKKILPVENESPKKYFEKSMDYYFIESYKRIDFIFKLMNIIPKIKAENADYTFLVKRFHPAVLVPHENNNDLYLKIKCNYYRPLFMVENELHKQIQGDDKFDLSSYCIQLTHHQFIRAKVYELCRYHLEYTSSDYKYIKNFISQHYNMLSYHQSNEIWSKLPVKPWEKLDKETQAYFRKLKKTFTLINDSLFPESPKRKPATSNE
jgi:hypothetical protein